MVNLKVNEIEKNYCINYNTEPRRYPRQKEGKKYGKRGNFKYFQPNKLDLKDNYGDCAVRTICKAEDLSWLDAYDMMYRLSRGTMSHEL